MTYKLLFFPVDKATSSLLLETDWDSILKICDLIRQGDVQAKYAVGQVKKKLSNENFHVVNYSLQVKLWNNCFTILQITIY
jgi:growth factor-regulated tyrosine kinase substrate